MDKKLVRIGIGPEDASGYSYASSTSAAVGDKGSFNFAVTEQEREFLGRLCKAIKVNCNGANLLCVQDLQEPSYPGEWR